MEAVVVLKTVITNKQGPRLSELQSATFALKKRHNGGKSANRFPLDPVKKLEWIAKLPQNMQKKKITRNMTVCAKHFAPDISYRKPGRFWIPDEPPTLFDVGGKFSLLPTHTPRKRKTEDNCFVQSSSSR